MLKPVLVGAKDLRPGGRGRIGDDHAPVMLRFDDNDAALCDQHMIDLGGTVGVGQREVIHEVVRGAREMCRESAPDRGFTPVLTCGAPVSTEPEAEPEADGKRDEHGDDCLCVHAASSWPGILGQAHTSLVRQPHQYTPVAFCTTVTGAERWGEVSRPHAIPPCPGHPLTRHAWVDCVAVYVRPAAW